MNRQPENMCQTNNTCMTACDLKIDNNFPVFSVIMPCYNSAEYVRTAIESITKQVYPYWELVAVNDGSTDDTLSILNEYAAKDSRIKIFCKPNGGYVSAVNLGLEKITGDYFLMLGSDDCLTPHLFQKLVDHLPQETPDCIAFRTIKVKDGELVGRDSFTNYSSVALTSNTTFAKFEHDYPAHASIFFTRDTSKCYKRSILGGLRYFGRYGIDADGIFSMLFCHRANSFASIPVDGYYWTLSDNSLSARNSFNKRELDRITNWMTFFSRLCLLQKNEITATEKAYINYSLNILIGFLYNYKTTFSDCLQSKKAAISIRKAAKYMDVSLNISCKNNFLLSFPFIWKVYYNALCSLKQMLHK